MTLLLILVTGNLALEPGPLSVAAIFGLPLLLVYFLQNQPFAFGGSLGLVLLVGSLYPGIRGEFVYRQRSFFGIHRVTDQGGYRKLFNGNTLHGEQSLDPARRQIPLTYYYPTGPIGQVMTALKGDNRLRRVALIGLGTGALASYAQPGQHWTFFEIDPAVAHIAAPATGVFTYLKDSPGQADVILGDARLTLHQQTERFGMIVVDAFGSDSIPLHLLTREALRVYLDHLEDTGILAFHISNKYVDLEPVLANLAADAGAEFACKIEYDLDVGDEIMKGKSPTIWLLMARRAGDLPTAISSGHWRDAHARPDLGVWTDDFSNVVSVLRFRD